MDIACTRLQYRCLFVVRGRRTCLEALLNAACIEHKGLNYVSVYVSLQVCAVWCIMYGRYSEAQGSSHVQMT